MISIEDIMKKYAGFKSNIKLGIVPGAVSMDWKGKRVGYVGFPLEEFVPKRMRRWLETSTDAADEMVWDYLKSRQTHSLAFDIKLPKYPEMVKMCRKIVKLGEGTAIANTSTGRVRPILRRCSRIARNIL